MDGLSSVPINNQYHLPLRAIVNPDFAQSYAVAMVDFGALDLQLNERQAIPAGSAHFLEHKLFAKPGYDSSQKYAQLGATSNAFTSYSKTAYLFKTVDHVAESLQVLLDLISQPYFTPENVAREREIITQEIQMYADMPDWILEQTTLNNLFPQDPINYDIAGTEESIKSITPEGLMQIYHQYYSTANLQIVLAGNVNPSQIEGQLDHYLEGNSDWQKFCQPRPQLRLQTYPHLALPVTQAEITGASQRPHMMLGIRLDTEQEQLQTMIPRQNQLELLLELILGDNSCFHQKLVDAGLIDDSFNYSVNIERCYAYVLISAETDEAQKLAFQISDYLFSGQYETDIQAADLELLKKDSIGTYLFIQDYMESLAVETAELAFYQWQLPEVLDLINRIPLADLLQLGRKIFQAKNSTVTYLNPRID
ncbi:insulinase family protein [Lactobacillus sp. DCY120]|uniref:Insulinase family protein n=1 Tax=Bombilactobacillus apium TaxID=2675299 RepID=A0A850RBY2_9LACO|nr:pitrilysin family protein [Bombilactobacillus apium]NVY96816.1 insulinase family protein [Bombilactobacillus apium]